MDLLTSAANAILNSPASKGGRESAFTQACSTLRDITNTSNLNKNSFNSSFDALLTGKITSKPKLRTPKKRKRSSFYSDENCDPFPKTPKNIGNRILAKESSPVTPTSNLKLLTRIASMEEPMSSKKNLFSKSNVNPDVPNPKKCDMRRVLSENLDIPSRKDKPRWKRHSTSIDVEGNLPFYLKSPSIELSRKDKSLGHLCERFLEEFPLEVSFLETPRKLVIDDVAQFLTTERRRVYDIVNILECLNMAARTQKNTYQWMGKQHLENTLSRLKCLAQKWGISIHLQVPIDQLFRELQVKESNDFNPEKFDQRRERSLGVLCQKFLMLFLTSPSPHVIPLDMAIHLLLGREGEDVDKARLRGRRIYDIANVLSALKLIKKVPQSKSFQYIGPEVKASELIEEIQNVKNIKCRHSLLPPLLLQFSSSATDLGEDLEVTPYEPPQPDAKKSRRPRKLASEFAGKVIRSSSEDRAPIKQETLPRHPSLQDICHVASLERDRLLLEEKSSQKSLKENFSTKQSLPLQRLNSPRIALTFQQNNFALSQGATSPNILMLKRIGSSSKEVQTPGTPSITRPIILIKTHRQQIIKKSTSENDVTGAAPHSLKLHMIRKPGEKTIERPNLPAISSARINQNASNISAMRESIGFKPLSVPNVSLNTISKNHYKTVFGSSAQTSFGRNLSEGASSYRFTIGNPMKISQSLLPPTNEEKRFVKIPFPSPDSTSSAEGELENIFGDSFKLSRPKKM